MRLGCLLEKERGVYPNLGVFLLYKQLDLDFETLFHSFLLSASLLTIRLSGTKHAGNWQAKRGFHSSPILLTSWLGQTSITGGSKQYH